MKYFILILGIFSSIFSFAEVPSKQEYIGVFKGAKYYTTPGGCKVIEGVTTCSGVDNERVMFGYWKGAGTGLTFNEAQIIKNMDDGISNTKILKNLSPKVMEPFKAAMLCDEMILDGKDDWFLPAINELQFLAENQHKLSGIPKSKSEYDRFPELLYWSSTLGHNNLAWFLNLTKNVHDRDFYRLQNSINNMMLVRCVRKEKL